MSHHSVKFAGNPVELEGPELKVGDTAPGFTVLRNDLSAAEFFSAESKTKIISVVPSLDTSVCDAQTRRFNEEAAGLGDNVEILTISVDLPFGQKRWCGSAGINKIQVLSDHRDLSFGKAYGVLMPKFRLLARAVFVVGSDNKLTHVEYVPEVTEHPKYDDAINAAKVSAGI